jgi:hypothetical protein
LLPSFFGIAAGTSFGQAWRIRWSKYAWISLVEKFEGGFTVFGITAFRVHSLLTVSEQRCPKLLPDL